MPSKELGRQYEPPQFDKNMQHDLQPISLQPIGVNPARQINIGDGEWQSRLMHGLSGLAQDIGTKYLKSGLDRAYLDGMAQADVAKSEEELSSNILTKDWVTAGYRDTRAKIALAEMSSTFQTDLKELRKKEPEEFKQYLTNRRNEYLNEHGSLSLAATEATAGQLMLQDQHNTQAYTTERFKYIVGERLAGYNTQIAVQTKEVMSVQDGVIAQQKTPEDVTKASRTLGGTIYTMWQDPSLPLETKQEFAAKTSKFLLSNNLLGVYDYLNNEKTPEGTTLLSQLTMSQQLEISSAHREAMNRTADIRNYAQFTSLANIKEAVSNGEYTGSQQELSAKLLPFVANGALTGEGSMAIQQAYAHSKYKKDQDVSLANFAMNGDVQSIINSGKSPQEGIAALGKMFADQKIPIEQQVAAYFAAGSNGLAEGYKEGGKILGISVQAIQQTGTPLPQHQKVFINTTDLVTKLEKEGRTDVRAHVLSGVPEDQRAFVENMMYKASQGVPFQTALVEAKKEHEYNATLSPAQKAAMASSKATEREEGAKSVNGRGVLRSFWLAAKSTFSDEAKDRLKIMPFDPMSTLTGITSDSDNILYYVSASESEVRASADTIAKHNPSLDTKRVMSLAYADVASRTIGTDYGPVILPKNLDITRTFGLPPGNQAALGHAVSGLLPKSEHNSFWRIRFQGGTMYASEYNEQSAPLGNNLVVTPDLIKNQVKLDTSVSAAKANKVYGAGDRVRSGGMNISFTGENTAGLPGQWAYDFRQSVLKNEKAVPKKYLDTLGNQTEGVGILSKSKYAKLHTWQDGKITSDSASRAFIVATNDALQVGQRVAKQVGMYNTYSVGLFSELAYQSGLEFMSLKQYKPFAQAMANKNEDAAVAAFKKTRAYEVSGGERKRHYLSLIEKTLAEAKQW